MFLTIAPPYPTISKTKLAPWVASSAITSTNGLKFLAISIDNNAVVSPDDITYSEDSDAPLTVTFPIVEDVSNPTTVEIGDSTYDLATDLDNPTSGEFIFDYENNEVVVYLDEDTPIAGSQITYHAPATPQTDCSLPLEQLLADYNVDAGRLSITKSFKGEANFSFSFNACASKSESIKSSLGVGTNHNCFGYKWVVTGLTIAVESRSSRNRVTVALAHFLAAVGTPSISPLDRPIKISKATGSSTYQKNRSLGELAIEVGVEYKGKAARVRTSRNTSASETTTLREQLENRAIAQHGFLFYSRSGVEIKTWKDTPTHVFNDDAILTESPSFSYQGAGTRVNGVKLHTEYRNLQVSLDFDEDTATGDESATGITEDWTFVNCKSLFELNIPAREINGILRSPTSEELRSPLVNFDVGGAFTKTATKTIRFNGTPTFQQTFEAGYCFSSDEVYEIEITSEGNVSIVLSDTANPQKYWQKVKTTTTDWIFDDDGYLKAIRVSGTQKARLQQESEKIEAAVLTAQAFQAATETDDGTFVPEPSLLAQAQGYKFTHTLPVNDVTTYSLLKHKDFYDDTVEPTSCEEKEDFVEPKFMSVMRRSREDFFVAENPKSSSEFSYPPIVSGNYNTETSSVKVVSRHAPQKYEVSNHKQTIEGENFKNAIVTSDRDYRSGKPGVHTRLNKKLDFGSSNIGSGNYSLYRNQTYYLNSPGVVGGGVKTNEGSKGYKDVDSPLQVRAIAQTELSIINSQNSLTTTIEVKWRKNVNEGDFALVWGRRWKIFRITETFKIENQTIIGDKLTLTLGYYLEPKLNLNNRSIC